MTTERDVDEDLDVDLPIDQLALFDVDEDLDVTWRLTLRGLTAVCASRPAPAPSLPLGFFDELVAYRRGRWIVVTP